MIKRLATKLALWLVERYWVVTPGESYWSSRHREQAVLLQEVELSKVALSARLIETEMVTAGLRDSLDGVHAELAIARAAAGKTISELAEREQQALASVHTLTIDLTDNREKVKELAESVAGLTSKLLVSETQLEQSIPIPTGAAGLLEAATPIVKRVESECRDGASGEYKRHVALDAMMNRYPSSSIRDITLAIELAVRDNL